MTSSVPGIGRRREAREDALTLLYEAELNASNVSSRLSLRTVPPDAYAVEIASGVDASRDELFELIGRHLKDWRVERMAPVDRVIASMAAWELCNSRDVPTGVVLSEAVELASQYSGEDAPRFLNGVLRAIADEVRSS